MDSAKGEPPSAEMEGPLNLTSLTYQFWLKSVPAAGTVEHSVSLLTSQEGWSSLSLAEETELLRNANQFYKDAY